VASAPDLGTTLQDVWLLGVALVEWRVVDFKTGCQGSIVAQGVRLYQDERVKVAHPQREFL
jgi:hypothetical protein